MNNPAIQHLLDIDSLSFEQLNALLDLAAEISRDPGAFANRLEGQIMINLFFEPSTRTRLSFEIAAKTKLRRVQIQTHLAAKSVRRKRARSI